jgi:hypothetical protein
VRDAWAESKRACARLGGEWEWQGPTPPTASVGWSKRRPRPRLRVACIVRPESLLRGSFMDSSWPRRRGLCNRPACQVYCKWQVIEERQQTTVDKPFFVMMIASTRSSQRRRRAAGRVIGRAEDRPPMRLTGLTLLSREAVPGGKRAGSGPVGPDTTVGALAPAYS